MPTPLHELLQNDGPDIYYSEGFRQMIENHLVYLRTKRFYNPVSVQANIAYVYEFDFYGLLQVYSIPRYLHWVTMRLNNYTSPTDYRKEDLVILIPDVNAIERLKDVYTTVQKIA